MNIENENNQEPEEVDDEKIVQEIVEEFNASLEEESDPPADPPAEPEASDPPPADTDPADDAEPDISAEEDSTVDDSDDSVPDTGGDETGFDEGAYRQEFASRYGLNDADLEGMGVEQLERFGRAMDRKTLDEIRNQQAPPQPQPQQFQPQPPHPNFPQQQMPPQQPQPQQPQQVDFNELKRLAEEEGYDQKFIDQMEAVHLQNQQLSQHLAQLDWQRQQQEQAEAQKIINEFDNALDSLKVKSVFGENRESAQSNQMHWQARENLFDMAVQFSRRRGQPLDAELVKQVASVLYPEQIQNSQQSKIVNKARKQHNNKLGSSTVNRNKQRVASNDPADYEGLDSQVPDILKDPAIARIFSAANDG